MYFSSSKELEFSAETCCDKTEVTRAPGRVCWTWYQAEENISAMMSGAGGQLCTPGFLGACAPTLARPPPK